MTNPVGPIVTDISLSEFITKTLGFGDCAFHAPLGEWNGMALECKEVVKIRKQLADIIKDIQADSPMFPFVVRGIEAQLMSGEGFSSLREQRSKVDLQNKDH